MTPRQLAQFLVDFLPLLGFFPRFLHVLHDCALVYDAFLQRGQEEIPIANLVIGASSTTLGQFHKSVKPSPFDIPSSLWLVTLFLVAR